MNIFQSILSAIRASIIRFLAGDDRTQFIKDLAGDDLIIVGDVYGPTAGPASVYVPASRNVLIIGNMDTHDGPGVIVPRGCKPPTPTIRAVRNGNMNDASIWTIAKPQGKLTNIIGGVGEVWF
jgi:hypothetical protein